MKQPIIGFHLDDEDHWVAKLHCGHSQHVRHDPPWSVREWVTTEGGRKGMIGHPLNCLKCDGQAPRDWSFANPPIASGRLEFTRNNVILYCRRWADTVDFYRHCLGLKQTFGNDWFIEFQMTTASFVSIANSARATVQDVRGQGITLSLQVNNLDQARQRLSSLDVDVGKVTSRWGSPVCYLRDPEGHRIELWQNTSATPRLPTLPCDLDSSVVDWVIEYPFVTGLFESLGIDYCCGGKSLGHACAERHLDPDDVVQRLRSAIGNQGAN